MQEQACMLQGLRTGQKEPATATDLGLTQLTLHQGVAHLWHPTRPRRTPGPAGQWHSGTGPAAGRQRPGHPASWPHFAWQVVTSATTMLALSSALPASLFSSSSLLHHPDDQPVVCEQSWLRC